MNDPLAALRTYLLAEGDITTLTGTRIYASEIKPSHVEAMPQACVLLRGVGGGSLGFGYQDYGDQRVDADCYGVTPLQAWTVYLAVYAALKHLRREMVDDVLLHWARVTSKGTQGRDPETDWPVTTSSWQVFAAEVVAV